MDIKARTCFNCNVYMTLNAATMKSQTAMDKFDKDHSHYMAQTVGYGEIGKGYSSRTREYLEMR